MVSKRFTVRGMLMRKLLEFFGDLKDDPVALVQTLQKKVIYLLYAAMILRAIETIYPGPVIGFCVGIVLLIFFVCELFLLPPPGMAIMSLLVVVLFALLPYVFIWISAFMAVSAMLFAAGAVVTFT